MLFYLFENGELVFSYSMKNALAIAEENGLGRLVRSMTTQQLPSLAGKK